MASMILESLLDNICDRFQENDIAVRPDARALLMMACRSQLESGQVASVERLAGLVAALTPDLVAAYRFKYGAGPMTFGRAVRFLADMVERWKELRTDQA